MVYPGDCSCALGENVYFCFWGECSIGGYWIELVCSVVKAPYTLLIFFSRYSYSEKGKEKEREKHWCKTKILMLPHQGESPQSRPVPWLGIKLAILEPHHPGLPHQFCQYLLHIFWGSLVWSVHVYNVIFFNELTRLSIYICPCFL